MTFTPLPLNYERAIAEIKADRQEIIRLRAELAAIPDILVQEAALVGENMILKSENVHLHTEIIALTHDRDGHAAENQRLRDALTAIINTAPGSAHRIARMALG